MPFLLHHIQNGSQNQEPSDRLKTIFLTKLRDSAIVDLRINIHHVEGIRIGLSIERINIILHKSMLKVRLTYQES